MSVEIPLILYDVNNKQIQYDFSSFGNTFFMRSYMDFDIRVLSGDAVVYRAKQNPTTGEPIVDSGEMFIGTESTNSYTLFLKGDCVLQCGNTVYKCRLVLDNVFSEELDDSENNDYPNSHYNTLLTNYFLPTWEELEPAIFGDNKRELIKRMLLDFRKIVSKKGTLKSIEMFFQFVGITGITLYSEYAHQNADGSISKTVTPNTTTDWKTGDYHVAMLNWKQEEANNGLNSKNLPIRKIHVEDLSAFFDKLIYAIVLADKYFTLPEQEISFFGVKYSSNIMMFPGMRSSVSQIEFDDVHHFRKALNIKVSNYFTSQDVVKLIDENTQITTDTFLSEVKVITEPNQLKDSIPALFWAKNEIFDDVKYVGGELETYTSLFGNVLHFDIVSPNTYVEVSIKSKFDGDVFTTHEKQYVEDVLNIKCCTTIAGEFDVVVIVWDVHNNREVYNYSYYINENIMIIDFETFNSVIVSEDQQNNISLGVSSPADTTDNNVDIFNYALFQKDVPMDLSEYYGAQQQLATPRKFLKTNKAYMLPDLNKNFVLDSVTETLPIGLLESWVDVFSFKYDPDKELLLRIYDGDLCDFRLIPYNEIPTVASDVTDKIMVTVLDIMEPNGDGSVYQPTPYVFITTTEMGIDIKTMYDFVLLNNVDGSIETIYTATDISMSSCRLPINYDYDLFIRPSKLVPVFNHYISGTTETEKTIKVKSLFPRLINISLSDKQTYSVKLGDVVFCRTNKNFIIGETDIVWEVRNAFTDEILFSTTDAMLKYRIEDNTIYTLVVSYKIKGAVHIITKESMFSSFDV